MWFGLQKCLKTVCSKRWKVRFKTNAAAFEVEGRCPVLPTHCLTTSFHLKDAEIASELEERAPTLHTCLVAAVSSKRKAGQKQNSTKAVSMANSVLP